MSKNINEADVLAYLAEQRAAAASQLPGMSGVYVHAFAFESGRFEVGISATPEGGYSSISGDAATFPEALAKLREKAAGNPKELREQAAKLIAQAEKAEAAKTA